MTGCAAWVDAPGAIDPDVNPVIVALAKRAGIGEEEAVVAARVATNKRYATEAYASDRVLVLGPLASWRVRVKRGSREYLLRWPSGFTAKWRAPRSFVSQSLEKRVEALGDIVLAEAENVDGEMVVRRLVVLHTRADFRAAACLVRETTKLFGGELCYSPWAYAITSLFVDESALEKCSPVLAALGLRFALLSARGLVHTAEWSVRAVLKSTFANIAEAYLGWERFTGERPSLATLVGDARTGTSRLAGANGVFFDEIGSWETRRDEEGFWATVRSGLANCVWKRAKGGEKSIAVRRCLPTYWAGNPRDAPLADTPPREHHRLWLERQGLDGEEAEAMMDRFSAIWGVVDVSVADAIMRALRPAVPAPGVVRAFAEMAREAQRRVQPPPAPGTLKTRQLQAWRLVYPLVRMVVVEKSEAREYTEALVRGLLVVDSTGFDVKG